jgi:hypothetical protein
MASVSVAMGEEVLLGPDESAVILGMKMKEIPVGHNFPWGEGNFTVTSVDGNGCRCKRVPSDDRRKASGPIERGTEPGLQRPEVPGLALLPFKNPNYKPGAGVTANPRDPKLGSPDPSLLKPGVLKGGDIFTEQEIEERGIYPAGDKQGHTWIMRSPQLGVDKGMEDQSRTTWASRERNARSMLNRMLNLRERKLSLNEEQEAIRMLVGKS